ncbi:hypothetical protein IAU60_004148 [Kwoniella sp. DSM 27419]
MPATRHASSASIASSLAPPVSSGSTSTLRRDSSVRDSPTASPRRTRHSGRKRQKREHTSENASPVYVVSRILARSLTISPDAEGRKDYHYLVRWEGYGPSGDTWEPASGLWEGASAMVQEFDDRDHLFTILASRRSGFQTYLVQYGDTKSVPPSPLYEKEWQTRDQMRYKGRLRHELIQQAITDFQLDKKSEYAITPGLKAGKSPNGPQLLAILDRRDIKPKAHSANRLPRYHVRWQNASIVQEEWLSREQMERRFGRSIKPHVKKWNEDMGYIKSAKQAEQPAVPPSEYELERQRNMEENKALMAQLGL